jgi:hypothetical protein
MRAFTQGITKEQFVNETKKHREMDNFMRGTYGRERGKACAVGCAIKSINLLKDLDLNTDDHSIYETHLGVPEWLARLEDTLFENISENKHKDWPVKFAEAINEGSDLNEIKVAFIVYLMEQNLISIRSCKYDETANPDVKKAIDQTEAAILQMINAQESGDRDKITAAESAAESAARSAESAAWSAAWSAARSAESAARSAESAAWSAARSAESAAFDSYAEKLLELIRNCR